MDGIDGVRAESHGTHGLDPAHDVDLVSAAQFHRGDDRRMRRAVHGWRRGNDARHSGNGRGQDRHVRAGDHRELSARHVAADRLDRYVPVPEQHARERLDLDVCHRPALRFGEAPDLRLSELDVLHVAVAHLLHRGLDLGIGKAKACGFVVVEPGGHFSDGVVATGLNVRKRGLDAGAHFRVVFGLFGFRLGTLQVVNRHVVALPEPREIVRVAAWLGISFRGCASQRRIHLRTLRAVVGARAHPCQPPIRAPVSLSNR